MNNLEQKENPSALTVKSTKRAKQIYWKFPINNIVLLSNDKKTM